MFEMVFYSIEGSCRLNILQTEVLYGDCKKNMFVFGGDITEFSG